MNGKMNGSTSFKVAGKSAIVTGAGSGVNLCFASLLLEQGCNVLIADLTLRPESQELVDKYSSKSGSGARAHFLKTDVSDWKQLTHMFEVAYEEFGDVDIVCPGAGVFEPTWSNYWIPPGTPGSKDSPDGGHYAIIDINLVHPIRTTQLAMSHFLSPRRGTRASAANPKRVVHVISIAGYTAHANGPLYTASKFGLTGFVRSQGQLDGRLDIRVNGVAPGLIKTPLWTDNPELMAIVDDSKDTWITPEEVAEAMMRCATDEDLPGGTILEVGYHQTRKVAQVNDPGPSGLGFGVSRTAEVTEGLFQKIKEASLTSS